MRRYRAAVARDARRCDADRASRRFSARAQRGVSCANWARWRERRSSRSRRCPPSVPGIRLYDILARAFQRAGGRLQIGSWVIRAETKGRRVIAVRTEAAAREARYAADAYLVATGGIAGGGLRTDHTGAIVETAFGLPVRAPADRANWFGPRFSGEQPIHHAGIATDAALRPIDRAGAPLYDNVVIAGAALGGADLLRERSYEGVALATGWHAAATLLHNFAQQSAVASGIVNAD